MLSRINVSLLTTLNVIRDIWDNKQVGLHISSLLSFSSQTFLDAPLISWTELNLNQKLFIQNKITTPCHNFLYLLPPDIMFRNCLWMRKLFLKVQSSCCHECMDGLLPTHLVKHDLQFLTHGNFWNGMIIWNIKID